MSSLARMAAARAAGFWMRDRRVSSCARVLMASKSSSIDSHSTQLEMKAML
jgi:hypothetical protein